jgi:hypothetical protein
MRIWFSYLTSANTTFEKYNYCKIKLFQKYYSYKNDYLKNYCVKRITVEKIKSEI